jgi:hypothetical protein
VSKAAHDLATLAGASQRVRSIAADGGYVSTELAKEVPYYAGAFGAALLSDSVSSNDALVFLAGANLAGANLGTAVYEYGLGRLTRAFLGLRSSRGRRDPRADISRPARTP